MSMGRTKYFTFTPSSILDNSGVRVPYKMNLYLTLRKFDLNFSVIVKTTSHKKTESHE